MTQALYKYKVRLEKLVYGGQALGELPDGRKVFVWNALPGEVVRVQLMTEKRTYAIGIAVDIVHPSAERLSPCEDSYLAISPWQIMTFDAENRYKLDITREIFNQHSVRLPSMAAVVHDGHLWHYRNKMEYCFSESGQGLFLALYQRAGHHKLVVDGSRIAMPVLDAAANNVCALLAHLGVGAEDLHTIVVRCSQGGDVVGALFVKTQEFPSLDLPNGLKGLRVYYSASKVFLSASAELLQSLGDSTLVDKLLGKTFVYDVDSFFQVNVPVFDLALARVQAFFRPDELVDMYAGVGSIGLSIATRKVDLIEADPFASKMAALNAAKLGIDARVLRVAAEKALGFIRSDCMVVLDPPRAGLHDSIVTRLLEVRPPHIVYLSCDPVTQARDLAKLQSAYLISYLEVFNFFPRTPHIEVLAILARR